jgi:magnesium-protoporphyrin O-methyltransferase
MPNTAATHTRRGELEAYFDRTAVEAWARLTSDAPGRPHPRHGARRARPHARHAARLAAADLRGRGLLDAGCGTGALAIEAARRGAEVVAIDLSPTLVGWPIEQLAMRSRHRVVVTFAPRTPLLTLMHWVGRLFPRGNRAPAIEPISPRALETRISRSEALRGWRIGRTGRIKSAFYISQYLELVRV